MKKARAFTLIEILIVVVLLGVLAAIVIPAVAGSSAAAKSSALAQELSLIRRFALIYKAQHLEVSPGYPGGDTTAAPTEQAFIDQATKSSNTDGETVDVSTAGYNRGPYLGKIPVNPFNGKSSVLMLSDGEDFPASPNDENGWIYKAATSEVRAGNTGTDGNGKSFYEY